MRCCARDEGRPFGTALRREVPNHRVLRWLKTVVVSDTGKGALDCVRWGSGRRCAVPSLWGSLLTCRYWIGDIKTKANPECLGRSPADGR